MITRRCRRCQKDRPLNGFATRGTKYRRVCRYCDKKVDWGDSPRLALIRHVFGDMTMRDVAYTIDIHRSNLYRWFEGTSNDKSTVTDRIAEFMERKREVRAGNARVLH